MSMSRKHFIDLADAIYYATEQANLSNSQHDRITQAIGNVCASYNGRFDRETFRARATTGPNRYSVIENVPGYLPDSNPATFSTRREAESYARDLASELRDEGWKVTGSASNGGYQAANPELIHDLGRVIEVVDLAYI